MAILTALRRILRAVEIASADLERAHGVTQPQLVCLRALATSGPMTQVHLSGLVHLSPSTLVGVIDRLEAKGLATRTRDTQDRRKILIALTDAGARTAATAPEPLHQRVQRALGQLDDAEITAIGGSLERLVALLDASGIAAAPYLASGPIPKPADQEGVGQDRSGLG